MAKIVCDCSIIFSKPTKQLNVLRDNEEKKCLSSLSFKIILQ